MVLKGRGERGHWLSAAGRGAARGLPKLYKIVALWKNTIRYILSDQKINGHIPVFVSKIILSVY